MPVKEIIKYVFTCSHCQWKSKELATKEEAMEYGEEHVKSAHKNLIIPNGKYLKGLGNAC